MTISHKYSYPKLYPPRCTAPKSYGVSRPAARWASSQYWGVCCGSLRLSNMAAAGGSPSDVVVTSSSERADVVAALRGAGLRPVAVSGAGYKLLQVRAAAATLWPGGSAPWDDVRGCARFYCSGHYCTLKTLICPLRTEFQKQGFRNTGLVILSVLMKPKILLDLLSFQNTVAKQYNFSIV